MKLQFQPKQIKFYWNKGLQLCTAHDYCHAMLTVNNCDRDR